MIHLLHLIICGHAIENKVLCQYQIHPNLPEEVPTESQNQAHQELEQAQQQNLLPPTPLLHNPKHPHPHQGELVLTLHPGQALK